MKNRSKRIRNRQNESPRTRRAIFYKSHGEYIGPYCNMTLTKREVENLRASGTLSELSNYILRSPLQLRRRVAK